MAKNDKQDLYNTAKAGATQAGSDYDKLNSQINSQGNTTWDRASQDYQGAFQGYSDYAGGAGLTDADRANITAAYGKIGGAGSGGGVSSSLTGPSAYKDLTSAYTNAYKPDYTASDAGYTKLASDTGGFNQDQLNQIYGNVGQLTSLGQTGGITDEDKANINRQSILDQEQTGGYSAQDKALIRAKSAASSPAYFSALKDNLQRQRSVTGNLAAGGAVDFKTARQAAQQQAADRTNADIGLQESIRTGKQQAGDFLSQQNMQLAGLRTANQLAGARSAGDLGLNTQQAITANQATGLQGLGTDQTNLGNWGLQQAGGLDTFGLNKAGGLDQYATNQAQLNMQASGINSSNAMQAAQAQADAQRWLTEYGNTQKQYGIGGLTDLYNTNLGASQNYTGMNLQGLGGKYGAEGNMLGLATQNRGATAMDNLKTIGSVAGTVAGAATGLGGLGSLAGAASKLIPKSNSFYAPPTNAYDNGPY